MRECSQIAHFIFIKTNYKYLCELSSINIIIISMSIMLWFWPISRWKGSNCCTWRIKYFDLKHHVIFLLSNLYFLSPFQMLTKSVLLSSTFSQVVACKYKTFSRLLWWLNNLVYEYDNLYLSLKFGYHYSTIQRHGFINNSQHNRSRLIKITFFSSTFSLPYLSRLQGTDPKF